MTTTTPTTIIIITIITIITTYSLNGDLDPLLITEPQQRLRNIMHDIWKLLHFTLLHYAVEKVLHFALKILLHFANGNNIVEIEQTFRNITDRMLRDDVFRRSSAVSRCEIHSIKFSGLNFDPTVRPQIVILSQNSMIAH